MRKTTFKDILKEKDWEKKFNLLMKVKPNESIRIRKNIKRKQARTKRVL